MTMLSLGVVVDSRVIAKLRAAEDLGKASHLLLLNESDQFLFEDAFVKCLLIGNRLTASTSRNGQIEGRGNLLWKEIK